MKTLVVLPSYNESQNIIRLTSAILSLSTDFYVCIVDDSSPDGTASLVSEALASHALWNGRVKLIVRSQKNGRGGAVRDGFSWGLQQKDGFEVFVEMDCDFSHEPEALPQGIALLRGETDVALGVRYPGGEIINWPLHRRIFSFLANQFARSLIEWSIEDYTNGFRFYTKKAAVYLNDKPQKHVGYIYLSESLAYLLHGKFHIECFPIRFMNRVRGQSNTTLAEILNAFSGLMTIAWQYHFPHHDRF